MEAEQYDTAKTFFGTTETKRKEIKITLNLCSPVWIFIFAVIPFSVIMADCDDHG